MFLTNQDHYGHYIMLYTNNAIEIQDSRIAKKLSISLQEYKNILVKFNAFEKIGRLKLYYFTNKKDCEECRAYLEEKYSIMLKLIGE